jgi:hypothetical protein
VAVLAGGCGDDGDETAPAAGKGSALELILDADGPGAEEPRTASIECPDPPSPDDDRGCDEVLLLSPEDLEPVPANVACTEIYGGPDTLTVSGTLEGEPVDGVLTRENGCEIERYDAWTPLAQELFPGYRPGASLAPPG